jgi:hypothetical protein
MLLSRRERAEGWCDSCGKKLPGSTWAADSRPVEPEREPAKPGGSFVARLGVALMCITPCAIIGVVAGGGKTTYLTAGCVVGAVVSMFVMQTMGLTPKKQPKGETR